ncbi:MAG: hypothetical protein Kow0075_12680 [Salibacteraceae bacterium]
MIVISSSFPSSHTRYYTLYISRNGKLCDDVLDYVRRKHIECLVIHVDDEGDSPPVEVSYYPVLFENGSVCAYGLAIIEHFQLHENRP